MGSLEGSSSIIYIVLSPQSHFTGPYSPVQSNL